MASETGGSFRFVSVHADDDDELVVHAGSAGHAAQAETSSAEKPEVAPQAGDSVGEARADEGDAAAETERSRKAQRLAKRAQEIEEAEEGLRNPKAFAGMQRVVILALVLLVVAVVAYTMLSHG